MKSKLILNEDEDIVVVEPIEQEAAQPDLVQTTDVNILSATNLINQMIKGEWDAIDLYNAVVVTIQNDNSVTDKDEIITTINDIVSEEYIHVGQLEKLLQKLNPGAGYIEAGINEEESKES